VRRRRRREGPGIGCSCVRWVTERNNPQISHECQQKCQLWWVARPSLVGSGRRQSRPVQLWVAALQEDSPYRHWPGSDPTFAGELQTRHAGAVATMVPVVATDPAAGSASWGNKISMLSNFDPYAGPSYEPASQAAATGSPSSFSPRTPEVSALTAPSTRAA